MWLYIWRLWMKYFLQQCNSSPDTRFKFWTITVSSSVAILTKAIWQYFPVLLFIIPYKMVLTFKCGWTKCCHSIANCWVVCFRGLLMFRCFAKFSTFLLWKVKICANLFQVVQALVSLLTRYREKLRNFCFLALVNLQQLSLFSKGNNTLVIWN